MSETKPKRPWFRFHLLTAVLMMLAASVLLGLSAHPRTTEAFDFENKSTKQWIGEVSLEALFEYGWPAAAYSEGHPLYYTPRIHWTGVLIDFGTMILLMSAVVCSSEIVLRRREAGTP